MSSYYNLTPETDPTAFEEKKDGRTYHLCDLPGPWHNHHVPFPYGECLEKGAWTWESKYSR